MSGQRRWLRTWARTVGMPVGMTMMISQSSFLFTSDVKKGSGFSYLLDILHVLHVVYYYRKRKNTRNGGNNMMWVDYNITQAGDNFRIEGDWPGEVMGQMADGKQKDSCLYKPGDVFIVNEGGWLVKSDELSAMIIKYEETKTSNEV